MGECEGLNLCVGWPSKVQKCGACKKRCSSWFTDQGLRCACRSKCASGNTDFSRAEFEAENDYYQAVDDEQNNQDQLTALAQADAEKARQMIVKVLGAAGGLVFLVVVFMLLSKWLKSG